MERKPSSSVRCRKEQVVLIRPDIQSTTQLHVGCSSRDRGARTVIHKGLAGRELGMRTREGTMTPIFAFFKADCLSPPRLTPNDFV